MKIKNIQVAFQSFDERDYISLTDISKYKSDKESDDIIKNWMRNRSTIEFLGLWEILNNPSFKPVEFDGFKKESGSNSFVLSPTKWIKATNAKGILARQGRGGGTYAHKDIAFEKVLSDHNLKPEECIFFDDSEKNIEVAQSLGIKSFMYNDLEYIKEKINKD